VTVALADRFADTWAPLNVPRWSAARAHGLDLHKRTRSVVDRGAFGRQGFGAMRLRDERASGGDRDPVAVVHAALDAGVTMVDTAFLCPATIRAARTFPMSQLEAPGDSCQDARVAGFVDS